MTIIPFFKEVFFFFFFLSFYSFFFVDSFEVIYDFYSRIYLNIRILMIFFTFFLITILFFFFFYFSFLLRVGLCAHSCWYFIYLIRTVFFFYHFPYDFWSTLFLTKDFFFFFSRFALFSLIRTLIFRRFELYLMVNIIEIYPFHWLNWYFFH